MIGGSAAFFAADPSFVWIFTYNLQFVILENVAKLHRNCYNI